MTVATLNKRSDKYAKQEAALTTWANLLESDGASFLVTIDRENGIIKNVLVLGLKSHNVPMQDGRPMGGVYNGTEYSRRAFQSLESLKSAKVRLNHPDRKNPNAVRKVEDGLGILMNFRATPNGTRADFHYNRQHPFAPQLIEDIERRMGQWGFSVNGMGVGHVNKSGVYVVEELVNVRSFDLVADPATTATLWESQSQESRSMTTVYALFESILPRIQGTKKKILFNFMEEYCAPKDNAAKVMEQGDELGEDMPDVPPMGDTPVEAPAEGGDPDEALSAGFSAAAKACIDQAMSGAMDPLEALKKLKELLTTHAKLTGEAPATPTETASTEEGESEEAKKKKNEKEVKESKDLAAAERAELARLRAEREVVTLSEQLDFKQHMTPTFMKALVNLSESDRRAFIIEQKKIINKPRSSAPPPPAPARQPSKPIADVDAFLQSITR